MKLKNYVLDENGKPRLEEDIIAWAEWVSSTDLTVARTTVGDRLVSTVFLGIDHNYFVKGEPILWETMVFKHRGSEDGVDDTMRRYSSREAALAGHEEIVQELMGKTTHG